MFQYLSVFYQLNVLIGFTEDSLHFASPLSWWISFLVG